MTFRELGLCAPILAALEELGYQKPSPIQEKAVPPALQGRDVLGCAQTGTGKTCAFAAPILQRLDAAPAAGRPIRALILTPTRELAIQIGESFSAYGKHLSLRHTVIFGGVGQNPQVDALKKGVDILVATPGRLMDLYDQGFIHLEQLEIFILDEADRMLDMGFIHDVRKILKWLPAQKQTMLFSATMPPEIADLVNSLLKDPVRVAVDPVSSPVEAIQQSVYLVDKVNKTKLLAHLVTTREVKNALVFTRTKYGANKVARELEKAGISAAAIHGNKSQTARQQALSDFKSGKIQCLVATDIAARGLDIEELSHVFNYNLPEVPETYIHRIGRTGRAGRGGEAIAFCDFSEQPLLKAIEKLIGRKVPIVEDHPFPMTVFDAPKKDKNGKVINEEDAEARAAARELRRAREEAKQAQEKPKPEQDVSAAPAPSKPAEKTPAELRSKKKAKSTAIPKSSPAAQVKPGTQPQPAKPKLTRPGVLLDTGSTMPRTEFHRPNPLDSDVIMDATARLLAPRKAALPTTQPRQTQGEPRSASGTRKRKKKPAAQTQGAKPSAPVSKPAQQGKQPAAQKSRTPAPAVKAAKTAAESQKTDRKPAPAPKKQRNTSARRRIVPEPRRQQPKDSTEQHSLMKPYYLDLGR